MIRVRGGQRARLCMPLTTAHSPRKASSFSKSSRTLQSHATSGTHTTAAGIQNHLKQSGISPSCTLCDMFSCWAGQHRQLSAA